jgi:hypothetical protein
MNIIDKLIKNCPTLREKYNELYKKELDMENKNPILNDEEWWKEYTEDELKIDKLSVVAKYRIFYFTFRPFLENCKENSHDLKKIFSIIENFLQTADEQTQKEIEVMLFEPILGYISNHPKLNSFIFTILGEKSRLLCERNNLFWKVKTMK